MLSQFLTDDNNNTTEIKTPILKVRGKTLVFGNVVYQIHNISSIGLVDRTTVKPIPKFFWALLLIGIVFVLFRNLIAILLGILILAFVAWLFYYHHKNKLKERYGLTIHTNAGDKPVLISSNQDFIKRVILTLYNIMNSNELEAVTFNFDNCSIDQSNKSIKIETNIESPIVSGHVEGDVVNEV